MSPKTAAILIKLMGWGFIIFGVVFVTISFPAFDGFAKWLTQFFDWSGQAVSDPMTRNARWYAAIMSGLSVGFGAFFVCLVAPLLSHSDRSVQLIAKRGGLIAAISWYVVDSVGSFAATVPSNVATNTVFLLAFIVPLLMVKFDD